MINAKKASLYATLGGALLISAAATAGDRSMHQEAVRDMNGSSITSTNGNCVVTKWTTSANDCRMSIPGDVRKLSREQRTVYFDFNKSTLNAKEKAKLDSLAKVITASKAVTSVDIVGYADQLGKPAYNKALSNRRAETVKSYLASKGLKTRKVRVEGMGEEKPVTDCDAGAERSALISCLAADRRVEIELNFVK